MTKNVIFRVVFLSLGILLIAGVSYGQTQINGAASGNWNNTASWSPATVPNNGGGNTYDVTLLSSPAVDITLNISPTIDTLTMDSGSELTTSASTTLTTTGLTNAGYISFTNSNTLTVNGTTTTSGTLVLGSSSTGNFNGSLTNSSSFDTYGGSTATVSGAFTNNSGGVVQLESSGDVLKVGSLTNNSYISIATGATLDITGGGSGITDVVSGSTMYVSGTFNVINMGTPASALADLTTVAGNLIWENGQTLTDTPTGGTLTINSGGALETYSASKLSVTGNVSNAGAFYTDGGSTVTVSGTLTNNNFVYMESSGDVLNVGSLTNTGEVYITTGATLNITGGGSGITDVVAGSSLYVLGTLNVVNGGTPSNGLADLTTVAGTLEWGANGQTLTDTPTGGTLTINSGGALETYNASKLSVTGNVSNSGDFYTDGGSTVTVSGTLTNNNFVYMESSGDVLNVGSLTNTGEVYIATGATLNITGGGQGITDVVSGSSLYVLGTLNVVNGGTPSNGLANLTTVAGTLEWGNGQTLTDTAPLLTINSGGLLEVYSGSTLSVASVSNSGNLYTDAMGTVTISGTLTNSGSIFLQSSGDVLNVGTLTNSGTVYVNPGATLNLTGATSTNSKTINLDGGILEISASKVTISGDGTIDLTGAGNIIEGAAGSDVLTLAKGQTIEGSGKIGNNLMGLDNQGIIDAQQTSNPLIIQAVGTTSNSGTMEATLGATLQLDAGTYTQTSTGAIIASETGSVLSTVNLESGVVINDGKLTITGTTATINLVGTTPTLTLNGVSISGTGALELADGSTTTLLGTITNTSTIDLNSTGDTSTLSIGAASVTLSGTGKIILASNGKDVITGASSSDTLHNGNTIEGPGNIGDGVIGLVNTGTIETVAHQTSNTEIDAGTAGFNNQGTVEAVASTTLYIDNASNQFLNFNSGTSTLTGGTYVVDGILEFDGASITTDAASITLSGASAKIENSTNSANALTNLNTIASGGTFDIITQTFTTTGNFTNNGTLDVGTSSKFIIPTADTLTNFSGTTLTGGAYNVTGTLEFAGANIVNNDASITLTGTKALIENSTTSGNALAGFANNEAGATFALASAAKFTTAGNFTNSGTLNVGTGSLFAVGASGADDLANFSSATSTLTGGTYIVTGTGQIQFNNGGGSASIVTNAANITLATAGSTSSFIDQTGANMLASFATNASTGSFTLETDRSFTTVGAFSNAGAVLINKGSTFTVGANGAYTNSAGSTTVNGTLTVTTSGAVDITGGTLFGDAGTINGNVNLTGSSIVDPGDGVGGLGDIKVADGYTQASSASLDIDLGGTAANTLYDVLDITDAASLNGTLNVDLVNGYAPKVNASFTILNYGSDPGDSEFSTYNLPTVSGDHWTITYNAKDLVIKLVTGTGANQIINNFVSGSAASPATGTVTASPAHRVSRALLAGSSASNKQEPVAILSRVTCFATRLIGSGSCDKASTVTATHGTETVAHAISSASSTVNATPHNNIMVATRSISAARGGATHETSASATAMARLYVCAYLPSTVGHTMGCN
jgi:fibronectin-binding autotransporter adhesin